MTFVWEVTVGSTDTGDVTKIVTDGSVLQLLPGYLEETKEYSITCIGSHASGKGKVMGLFTTNAYLAGLIMSSGVANGIQGQTKFTLKVDKPVDF